MQKPRSRFHQSNAHRSAGPAPTTRGLRPPFQSRYVVAVQGLAALPTVSRRLNWEIHLGFLSSVGFMVVGQVLAVKRAR